MSSSGSGRRSSLAGLGQETVELLTLIEASPWLRDDNARIAQILTVAEINSVAKGLPPFQEETRKQIRQRLSDLSAHRPRPAK